MTGDVVTGHGDWMWRREGVVGFREWAEKLHKAAVPNLFCSGDHQKIEDRLETTAPGEGRDTWSRRGHAKLKKTHCLCKVPSETIQTPGRFQHC